MGKHRAADVMRRFAPIIVMTITCVGVGLQPSGLAAASSSNGRIAFQRGRDIYIAQPDGSDEYQLELPISGFAPVWSPNGTKLLVTVFTPSRTFRPATVNPDGSGFAIVDVPEAPTDLGLFCRAWSPDATRFLCQGMNDHYHRMDGIYSLRASDGGDLERLTVNPYPPTGEFGGGDIPGDYSPDGSRFVFMRARPGHDPNARHQQGALFIANADGSGLHRIVPYGLANSHDNGLARWSPDGREIVFASSRGRLFLVHPDGTGLRRITLDGPGLWTYVFTPDWSPDGARLVFSASVFTGLTGQEDIYTADRDGSDLAKVTDTNRFEDFANWG